MRQRDGIAVERPRAALGFTGAAGLLDYLEHQLELGDPGREGLPRRTPGRGRSFRLHDP